MPVLTRSVPSQNPLPRSRLIPYDAPRVQMALPPQKSSSAPSKDSTANLGFEAKLWLTADRLRNNPIPSRTLATLRDTLLPKLLSGELTVDITNL